MADGWSTDFSAAPRSLDVEIRVRLKGGVKEIEISVPLDDGTPWAWHVTGGPELTVFWHDHPKARGWTTGGCARLQDEHLECWRLA